ncbi:hypothetical protein ACG7TL_005650 [Trametes sanguinea]
MTLPSPVQLRVSDSTPQFLLQKSHGPPSYFLHRIPSSPLRSSPSAPQLKQKRSFKVPMRSPPPPPPGDDTAFLPPVQRSRDVKKADSAPDATATPVQSPPQVRRTTSPPLRLLPMATPPPEKALPPIPFPSSGPPSPTSGPSDLLQPMQHAVDASVSRPVSQDAEETIRQLEQLAAELKQMGPGVLAATKQRRSRVPSHRRRRDVLSKSPGTANASKGTLPNRQLSVPRIVVTNPSSENLVAEPECATPGVRTPDSDGGSGDVTEEELWVDSYGAWGTSDKGKWKASAFDEDDEPDFHESASASDMHDALSSERAATSKTAESEEAFYIYEPIGAPEFLVGSSTSLVARATAGFYSRRRPTPSKTHSQCVRRRRRRPTALVLATPEQAEWFADVVLGSAPPDVPRLPQTPKQSDRPSTAPGYETSALDAPARSSPLLPQRRAMSSDVPDPAHAVGPLGPNTNTMYERRSEPLGASIPRAASAYEASPQGRQASWVSLARKDAVGTSSEPNSPRQGVRPRLKSIKGLFKHFSKSETHSSQPAEATHLPASPPSKDGERKHSPSATSPRDAPHPFNKPDTDLLLRSSDDVEFRVRSHILIEASPVFESMLSSTLPTTKAVAADSCRTLGLDEDSATIEALLRLCYPVVIDPAFWSEMDAKKAEPVLRAAFKYKMELAESRLMEHINSLAKETPIAVWAIACRFRLEETAAHAAWCSLRTPALASHPDFDPEDLEGVSAGQYYRLRTYHRVQGKVDEDYRFVDPTPAQESGSPSPLGKQPGHPLIHIPSPNLICLSCDGTEFRVRKEPLCASSSVIRTLVETAERQLARSPSFSSSDSEDDAPSNVGGRLPSIQLGYSVAVLSTLFRFYNLWSLEPFPSDPRAVAEVLAATREYQMHGLYEIARKHWDTAVTRAPLPAYLAAISHGLNDCAREAAKLTLSINLENRYFHDLEDWPALAYHRLTRYHKICGAVAATALTSHVDSCFFTPASSSTSSETSSHKWLNFHARAFYAQLSLRPGLAKDLQFSGFMFEAAALQSPIWCSECSPLAQNVLHFSDALRSVASRVDKVTLRLETP